MDPEEDRVFLSPEEVKRLLDETGLADGEGRREIAAAIRGVGPRDPAIVQLERIAGRSAGPTVLDAALTLLRHLGRPGVAALHRMALNGPHPEVKAEALYVLASTAPGISCFATALAWEDYRTDAWQVACEAVADQDPSVREAALEALLTLGPAERAFPRPIFEAIADPDASVRAACLRLMRHEADSTPWQPDRVVPLLSDPDASVRMEAARFLENSKTETDRVLPVLLDFLRSPDPEQRASAAKVIGRYGPVAAAAVPLLEPLLEQASPEELRALLEAIEGLGPAAAPLIPKLSLIALVPSSPLDEVFRSLARVGVAAVPALVNLLQSPEEDRRYRAALALRALGTQAASALPALWHALEDPVARVRFRVAQAILLIDAGAVQRLADYLVTRSDFDRSHLMHYLAEEKEKSLPVLQAVAARLPDELQAAARRHIEWISNSKQPK